VLQNTVAPKMVRRKIIKKIQIDRECKHLPSSKFKIKQKLMQVIKKEKIALEQLRA
jgi:hypothetical protein